MTTPNDVHHVTFDARALAELAEYDPDGSLVRELIDVYLDDTPLRIHALHLAFDAGDPNALAREAHALKSSCAQLGASALAGYCQRLERIGREGSIAGVGEILQAVDRELEEVRQALAEERDRRR